MFHFLCSCSYLFTFLLSFHFCWHIRLESTAYFFDPPCISLQWTVIATCSVYFTAWLFMVSFGHLCYLLLEWDFEAHKCAACCLLYWVCIVSSAQNGIAKRRTVKEKGSKVFAVVVCPSIRPSQAGIVSKRLGESSWFLAWRLPIPDCVDL